MKANRRMTREEYLEYLAFEEKRNRILSDLETDPAKKTRALRKSRSMEKLRQYVLRTSGYYRETIATPFTMESPEK